jgi:branched-chain amino acid transport system substrate-binding protein
MKKILIMILAMACPIVFSVASHAKEPVYIGLSAPMSGQYAAYGDSFKKAIDLAAEQINAGGGLKGQSVELIVEDSQGDPKLSKRIARKFTEDKRIIAVIGDFTSSCSMSASPFYERGGMVQLSPTASHPSFAPGSPYSFSLYGTQETADSPFMARMAVERLGKKRLAVAYLNTDWGIVVKKFFTQKAVGLGAEIVAEESYFDGTSDFSMLLEKIRAATPDILFLSSMIPDAASICRQRKQSGWDDVLLMAPSTLYTPEFIKVGGDAAENLFTCAMFFPEDPQQNVQDFVAAYKNSYDQIPDWLAAIAYDAMNLLAEVIKKGDASRKAVYETLSATKEFSGVTGKITLGKHGNVLREYRLLQVKNQEFVLYAQ